MFNEELKFPVEWKFRVIVESGNDISDDLIKVMKSFGYNELPKAGNSSKGGKYQTWQVKATFQDKATMDLMAEQLRAIPGIKMVL